MDSVKYRLLRNQMVIMLALRNIVSNDNIKGLLDDNIEPTADMLQCNELSNYNHYQQGRADAIKDFADWLVKYKVISDSAMHELIRDFNGEMNND